MFGLLEHGATEEECIVVEVRATRYTGVVSTLRRSEGEEGSNEEEEEGGRGR